MISVFNFSIKLILIFFLLFDVNFLALPIITTARLAMGIIFLICFFRKVQIPRKALYYLVVLVFILGLVFLQYLYSNEATQLSRFTWFVLYGIFTPLILVQVVKNRSEFFLLVSVATAVQAVIAIISFVNPSLKSILYNSIIFTANFDETQVLRAVSFSSVAGASLSLVQSFGVISSLLMLHFSECSFKYRVLLWANIILILISIFLIGRTGLIISFLAILIYLIPFLLSLKKVIIASFIVLIISQINYLGILESSMDDVDGFNLELFTAWIENAFSLKDNATSEDIQSMQIPPLSFETIVGTGKVTDLALGGNASGHDSGYIQAYYSLGLILAIFFYATYFIFLSSLAKGSKELSLYLIIILVFIVEVKEPFIFQYTLPFFALSSILVYKKFPSSSANVWKSLN
ncbi:MAG: hypothetical protein NWS46_12500 [Cyclobacteriaceae bacterium]|nr:hypothetical protein [Cyclobacteriaceae bacterium]